MNSKAKKQRKFDSVRDSFFHEEKPYTTSPLKKKRGRPKKVEGQVRVAINISDEVAQELLKDTSKTLSERLTEIAENAVHAKNTVEPPLKTIKEPKVTNSEYLTLYQVSLQVGTYSAAIKDIVTDMVNSGLLESAEISVRGRKYTGYKTNHHHIELIHSKLKANKEKLNEVIVVNVSKKKSFFTKLKELFTND